MRRTARNLAILAALAFALAPALAEARPGGGSSSGSRGARTYAPPAATQTAPRPAQPMQRTTTEPARPAAPAAAPAPGAARPAAQPGFFQRNPFMGGLMAGMLGAGLFGLLAGSGFFGGLGSLAGVLGFLLQIALIAGLVFLVVSLLRRRAQPQPAGVPQGMMREAQADGRPMAGAGGGRARPADEIGIGPDDYAAFERLLQEVNAAWSREDVAALQRLTTPEMAQYFRDDFAALAARGWKNESHDVRLEQGDLAEAWREGARDYATVAMRFSLVDVTREVATGRVVEGDPAARQTATELWTFVRVQGGPWTLSAIQQTG
jgi:predicted lipid-binding transport protein (Tim44 family)